MKLIVPTIYEAAGELIYMLLMEEKLTTSQVASQHGPAVRISHLCMKCCDLGIKAESRVALVVRCRRRAARLKTLKVRLQELDARVETRRKKRQEKLTTAFGLPRSRQYAVSDNVRPIWAQKEN